MALLIKNGRVIDPKSKRDEEADILIENGKIVRIAANITNNAAEILDAKNKIVVPGLVDIHAHFREPGYEYKETILSASHAAAAGGYTSVCCMPNTNPVIDNQGVVEFILSENKKAGLINLFPIGSITKSLEGKELSELGDLKDSGCVAFSDDGHSVMNAEIMRRALEYSLMVGLPIISHCEEMSLAAGGVMNEGYISAVLGLKGIPSVAETVMVARDIQLARYTGARLHIAHVSCRESVELIRTAKANKVAVTCECCPHHFTLSDEAVLDYDTNTKVNPPLRTKDDINALLEGVKDGTIDCIATDHAPHAEAEKDVVFDQAPFGIIGLETALALGITELVEKNILTINELIEKMSYSPARVLGLDNGYLEQNASADITIIDTKRKWIVKKDNFLSKSRNSPFIGMQLTGCAVATIVKGRIIFKPQ
ncbi:MAG: dihydroorotase [Candidatus Omnitrophica bacterium]|nr:dihydroorotase [Candidatus Omnitrophota bacterium]